MKRTRFKLLSLVFCTLFIVILSQVEKPQRLLANAGDAVSVTYQAHVQHLGWQKWVEDGVEAGTDAQALRVEALKIKLINAPPDASIKYQAHVQSVGWQPLVADGVEAGTDGKSLRVEAIKITLENMPGYTVQYQAHVQNIGWQDWVSDGIEAGTHGQSLRVEAIRIRVVPIISLQAVSINKTTDNLTVGGKDTLSVALTPTNATNKAVTWSSSKPSVAAVDKLGKVTAISAGIATITATSADANKTANCVITVSNLVVHPISVSINKTTDKLAVGAMDTLIATVNPASSTNKAVTWSSSDPSIASVDNNGKITMLSEGAVVVTVTTVDGNRAATCIVSGNKLTNNNKITLTNYNISLSDFSDKELLDTPAAFINGEWSYALIKNGEQGYCTDPLNPNDTWVCSPTDYNNIKNQLLNNINPLNIQNDPTQMYEFVRLSYSDCVTAAQLNTMFGPFGVLSGKGQVFIDAAKANNVNPIYLAGHAILESNHGTSLLATGGTKDVMGNYTFGIPVYDLFGIGAIDGDADCGGTRTAYSKGWTSVDLAICGGAAWISNSYINNSQDTLYSMRWNPLNILHQYATDVNWAASQTRIIKSYFDLLPGSTLTFNIPVFN